MSMEDGVPVGYINITVSARVPVYDLAHYEATTLVDAMSNMSKWYDDGTCSLLEDISGCIMSAKLSVD